MAEVVYAMCAMTSALCAVLLARSYRSSGVPLVGWSAVCFAALTGNNVVLFVDLVVIPDVDLMPIRSLVALVGLTALLFRLVWDAR
jgi:hypothetical protein